MTSPANQSSPLRRECLRVILESPGVTMVGIARRLGEKVNRIDHLVRRLVMNGSVVVHHPEGAGMIRHYFAAEHADMIPAGDIFTRVRRDWLGYRIHKVFGGGGKVRLTTKALKSWGADRLGLLTPAAG